MHRRRKREGAPVSICQACKEAKIDVAYYPDTRKCMIYQLATGTLPFGPEGEGLICYECARHFHRMYCAVEHALLRHRFIFK